MSTRSAAILPVIVFSQLSGTSLWFAGNAVIGGLRADWDLPASVIGSITASVQAGFITGTLIFAIFNLADRLPPRWLFFYCSLAGALANILICFFPGGLSWLLLCRFLTGFFLAGIYPVGMKIAASWYRQGLGRAIGWLVGALVLGTALPHGVQWAGTGLPWRQVLLAVSGLAVIGGLLLLLVVPDGPYLKKTAQFDPRVFFRVFRAKPFRAAALGYFGHMWELYAWWAFLPMVIAAKMGVVPEGQTAVSQWTFLIIAVGALGCIAGGWRSQRTGSGPVAWFFLASSAICCLISPLMFALPLPWFLGFLAIWGVVVIGDSPQFSTLTAQTAPSAYVGSALTITTCLGFALTIVSIQFTAYLAQQLAAAWLFLPLAVGPLAGLFFSRLHLRKLPAAG